jgi:hypothetical protein
VNLRACLLALLLGVAASVPASLQEIGGEDENGPYDVVPGWLKPLPTHDSEWGWGNGVGVFAESPDRVFIITRGDLPAPKPRLPGQMLLSGRQTFELYDTRQAAGREKDAKVRLQNFVVVVNRNGQMVENWSQWDSGWQFPHRIKINPYDPEKHVWIVDNGRQQVLKFTNDGKKLVMAIGVANEKGDDQTHLGGVVDLDWLPDGTIFVADGGEPPVVTSRVVKYTPDGKYIKEWGGNGSAPGEFGGTHGIAIDTRRRVYVGDRRNHRIQVFDEDGKLLKIWPNIRQVDHMIATSDGYIAGVDGATNKVLRWDLEGRLKDAWGTGGPLSGGAVDGQMNSPHGMSVDRDGNLYIADFFNYKVQKFQPKKGADKSRLIAMPLGWNRAR